MAHTRWRQKVLGVLGLACALGLASAAAQAREWQVAGTKFARIYEQDAAGEFVGLGVDVLREFARRQGDTVRFGMYPWIRAQKLVVAGTEDVLVGPYKTPERETLLNFSERAFYQDQMAFYALPGTVVAWSGDYAQLANRPIIDVRGWAYGADFDAARSNLRVETVTSLENAVGMMLKGRGELLATNLRNTEGLLHEQGMDGRLVPLKPIISSQVGYFAFPKTPKHAALKVRFDAFFQKLVADGDFAKLAAKHKLTAP